jgi:UDP-3-O-[3-hydroxymyristoyl] glucosamine N-acyltransferase
MLINYDPSSTLYLVGNTNSITVREIFYWIKNEASNVKIVTFSEFENLEPDCQGLICSYNLELRSKLLDSIKHQPRRWPSFIHHTAFVSQPEKIGKGVIFYPMTFAGLDVQIGDHSSIAQLGCLSHGCKLGVNVLLGPKVIIGGSSTIGDNVYIGQGSIVRDKVDLCSNLRLAMNSQVSKTLDQPGTYFGNRKWTIDTKQAQTL